MLTTEDPMPTPDQDKPGTPGQGGAQTRSENLLPAESGKDDGRFDVAEEVNLDQQSDSARRVGQADPTTAQDEVQRNAPGAR
jgi:hypothetical protein